jgi:hypothetical protein
MPEIEGTTPVLMTTGHAADRRDEHQHERRRGETANASSTPRHSSSSTIHSTELAFPTFTSATSSTPHGESHLLANEGSRRL